MARNIEINGTNTKETIASHNTLILEIIKNLQEIETEGEIIKSFKLTIETVESEELKIDTAIDIVFPLGGYKFSKDVRDSCDSYPDDYSRGCCDEL